MNEVYASIAAVQGALAKTGISKNRKNQQGSGYMFRGIDDIYAALSPLLSANGLVVIPRVISREVVERSSRGGGALFYVTVHAEFDFVSAKDGSKHTAATFGEVMDSGDKATNKAMSAAYKYAAFMTFAIPTEGDNDADATTHDVMGAGSGSGQSQQGAVSTSASNDDGAAMVIALIEGCQTLEALKNVWTANQAYVSASPEKDLLTAAKDARKSVIEQTARFAA